MRCRFVYSYFVVVNNGNEKCVEFMSIQKYKCFSPNTQKDIYVHVQARK